MRYLYDGSRFIVQYTGVTKLSSSSPLTFQVILYPSGKILFQYLTMSGTLNSATIGIQNADRTIGLLVSANENYVHNNLAIEFSRAPDWLEVTSRTATIPAGGFKDFAKTDSVVIVRQDQTVVPVNFKRIAEGKDVSQNVVLVAGDTIVVP